jgi:hypothetical protein
VCRRKKKVDIPIGPANGAGYLMVTCRAMATKPIRKQEAPLKPEYQARFEASMRDQDLGGMGLDMAYSCRPPGMPRMMSGVALMEFLTSPGVTHILFDRNDYAPRRIYTDGREWPKIGIDDTIFPGYSIGEWIDKDGDGRYDELLVETRMCAIRAPGPERHADGG